MSVDLDPSARLSATEGRTHLTGLQALARVPIEVRRATAVHGSQLVPGQDDRTVDGVTGYWYGKSPGLDRAADALRHRNLAGAHHGVVPMSVRMTQ